MTSTTDELIQLNYECIRNLCKIKEDAKEHNVYDAIAHYLFLIPYESFDPKTNDFKEWCKTQRKRRAGKILLLHLMYKRIIDREHIDMIGEIHDIPDLYNHIISLFPWTPFGVLKLSINDDFVYPKDSDILMDFSHYVCMFIAGEDLYKILENQYKELKED